LWSRRFAWSWYRITDLRFGLIKQFFIGIERRWWWQATAVHAIATSSRHASFCVAYRTTQSTHIVLLCYNAGFQISRQATPMNDIKEYFTANNHPLISHWAQINQRLRATVGSQWARYTTTRQPGHRPRCDHRARQAARSSAASAGRWPMMPRLSGRQRHITAQSVCTAGSYTKFNQRSTVQAP